MMFKVTCDLKCHIVTRKWRSYRPTTNRPFVIRNSQTTPFDQWNVWQTYLSYIKLQHVTQARRRRPVLWKEWLITVTPSHILIMQSLNEAHRMWVLIEVDFSTVCVAINWHPVLLFVCYEVLVINYNVVFISRNIHRDRCTVIASFNCVCMT